MGEEHWFDMMQEESVWRHETITVLIAAYSTNLPKWKKMHCSEEMAYKKT